MANIELVIKIPEEEYRNICLMSKGGIGMALYDWIANGKPLPKGHGDLIDRKDVSLWTAHLVDGIFICDAPTIIEADKRESEVFL